MRRRLLAIALGVGLVAASSGCSGDDSDGTAAPTSPPATAAPGGGPATSATSPATASPGSSVVPTTGPAPASSAPGETDTTASGGGPPAACPDLAPVPADAEGSGARQVDVDDDGQTDLLTSYSVGASPGAGSWRLRVELQAGGGAEYALPEDPAPAPFQVIGTSYVGSTVDPGPGGQRPVIFAWVNSGASAKVVGLYRLDGCTIVPLTGPGGGPATLIAGGSIGHQEGARCEGVAGTSLLVEVLSEAVGDGYEVTERAYTRNGNTLEVYGQPAMRTSPSPPPEAGKILCGDVSLD